MLQEVIVATAEQKYSEAEKRNNWHFIADFLHSLCSFSAYGGIMVVCYLSLDAVSR